LFLVFSEQKLITAQAEVLTYDDGTKAWVQQGSSKVSLYQQQSTNQFRIVGRHIQTNEVFIDTVSQYKHVAVVILIGFFY